MDVTTVVQVIGAVAGLLTAAAGAARVVVELRALRRATQLPAPVQQPAISVVPAPRRQTEQLNLPAVPPRSGVR